MRLSRGWHCWDGCIVLVAVLRTWKRWTAQGFYNSNRCRVMCPLLLAVWRLIEGKRSKLTEEWIWFHGSPTIGGRDIEKSKFRSRSTLWLDFWTSALLHVAFLDRPILVMLSFSFDWNLGDSRLAGSCNNIVSLVLFFGKVLHPRGTRRLSNVMRFGSLSLGWYELDHRESCLPERCRRMVTKLWHRNMSRFRDSTLALSSTMSIWKWWSGVISNLAKLSCNKPDMNEAMLEQLDELQKSDSTLFSVMVVDETILLRRKCGKKVFLFVKQSRFFEVWKLLREQSKPINVVERRRGPFPTSGLYHDDLA